MSHIVIDGRIINSTTGRYVERLLYYLQDVDTVNKYTILVPSKDKDFFVPKAANFTIQTADFANYSIAEQNGLKKLLDRLEPDLVHFCMPQQPVRYKGATVTTFHDLTLLKTYMSDKNWFIYKTKQFIGRFVFKKVVSKSEQLITDTDFTKHELIDFDKRADGKTTTIYLASELPQVEKLSAYDSPFEKFILYVGQQPDFKNIRRLAEAHQRLIKKYPDLGLILVGRLASDSIANKALFESKGYKNIHFTGFIEDDQRDWLYKNSAAYVFPSLMEGFGLPGLEAMAHGSPVVSSNATCLPEVYGDAVHYFDPTDTTDMARAIDEVLSDDALRKDLIDKGYKQLKKYSWRRTAEKTHEVYLKALESKSLPEQL